MRATRRRGADLENAIYAAVLDELWRHGYTGLTFEGVAAAAATSKPVLYRRWPTKAQMVLAAWDHAQVIDLSVPDTGSLRGDLVMLMRRGREQLEDRNRRQIMLGVLADVDEQAAGQLRELIFARSGEAAGLLIERARERGDLGDSPIPARVATLPMDLLRHEILLRGTLGDRDIDELVDDLVLPLYVDAGRCRTRGIT